MGKLSHLSTGGAATMVDTSGKPTTLRYSKAKGYVSLSAHFDPKVIAQGLDAIVSTARIAGIMAAKQTSSFIPLCHPIFLSDCQISIQFLSEKNQFEILSETKSQTQTGVEMEALCGLQIAALTIYDMIKSIDPGAILGPFWLLEKSGGKKDYSNNFVPN